MSAQCRSTIALLRPCCICSTGEAASDPLDAGNHMGPEGMPHRVAAIRDRSAQSSIVGLIYRDGRHASGRLSGLHVLCYTSYTACLDYKL